MNVEIVSNTISKLETKNYTNKFKMVLEEPIDCENVDRYMKVLNVTYPKTTKNVDSDLCYFYFKITYANFRKDTGINLSNRKAAYVTSKTAVNNSYYVSDSKMIDFNPRTQVTYNSDEIVIPQGIYEIDDLIHFFNSYTKEFDIYMEKEINGKILINVGLNANYLVKQTSGTSSANGDVNILGGDLHNNYFFGDRDYSYDAWKNQKNGVGGMRVQIYISEKLNYLLGDFSYVGFPFLIGKKSLIVLEVNSYDAKNVNSLNDFPRNDKCMFRNYNHHMFSAKYLPDIRDGINKIFVYCEEIEKQIVGNYKTDLLCIVPLQYEGQGTGELAYYAPPNVYKKLLNKKIHEFNIALRDNKGNLINFDFGTVSIQVLID